MAEDEGSRVVQLGATLRGTSRDGTADTREAGDANDERVDNGEE